MDDSAVEMELRIDWSEIDAFGHVNNLAILRYVQDARVNYLDTVGQMQSQANSKIGPILASTSCQFRRPLFYPGRVIIRSRVDGVKNTSFRICHKIYNDATEVAAEAQDIIVLFDYGHKAKVAIPVDLRERIEHPENLKVDYVSTA